MVIYGITLVPLAEELRAVAPDLPITAYAYDAVLDGLSERSTSLMRLLLERWPTRGYFPELDNSIFICD